MKKIPFFTLLLWLLIIFGYCYHSEWFLKEYVQYPLVVLLSILLPVSFWQKNKEKKKVSAAVYLALFFINITFLLQLTAQNYNVVESLETKTRKGIIPEIAELLSEPANSEKNRFAARFIYQNHAISIPYRSSTNDFSLYLPTVTDRAQYQQNAAQKTNWDMARMAARSEMISTAFLLLLHTGIFLLILPFLILYDQK